MTRTLTVTRTHTHKSVLQDWVMELPLRHQGTLIVATRGCDTAPKQPYDSTERQLVAYLRYLILNPADVNEVGIPGSFMKDVLPSDWNQSDLGHYPLHFVSHLMHAYEVVGHCHPDPYLKSRAYGVYCKLVKGLHLNPESEYVMDYRLTEDRIKNGNVVS